MQFFNFHLMPWPHVPDDFDDRSKYPSAWVTFSNEHYDPDRGQDLYNRYLDELEYAEKLGFDGVCVNEHHQNTYGTMPSPNIIAALLARRTSRMKIAMVGNGFAKVLDFEEVLDKKILFQPEIFLPLLGLSILI